MPVGYDKAVATQRDNPIIQELEVVEVAFPRPATADMDPIAVIGTLINLGKELWPIIEAGKPVSNVAYDFASATVADATGFDANQTLARLQLRATNGFGTNAVSVDLAVVASTNGTYVALATVVPSNLSVLWGYTLDLRVKSVAVVPRRTCAAVVLVVESTVSTVLKKSIRTYIIDIAGDGTAVIN